MAGFGDETPFLGSIRKVDLRKETTDEHEIYTDGKVFAKGAFWIGSSFKM
jgi:hypothetical protein